MDREFITRNQIVERYIGGRLPLKGAQDFERFCREHPELLDEIALTERINAALRLLDAGGRAAPWEQRAKRWWEQLPVLIGSATLALALAMTCLLIQSKLSARERSSASPAAARLAATARSGEIHARDHRDSRAAPVPRSTAWSRSAAATRRWRT